jgi:hypothetical protein
LPLPLPLPLPPELIKNTTTSPIIPSSLLPFFLSSAYSFTTLPLLLLLSSIPHFPHFSLYLHVTIQRIFTANTNSLLLPNMRCSSLCKRKKVEKEEEGRKNEKELLLRIFIDYEYQQRTEI